MLPCRNSNQIQKIKNGIKNINRKICPRLTALASTLPGLERLLASKSRALASRNSFGFGLGLEELSLGTTLVVVVAIIRIFSKLVPAIGGRFMLPGLALK